MRLKKKITLQHNDLAPNIVFFSVQTNMYPLAIHTRNKIWLPEFSSNYMQHIIVIIKSYPPPWEES